MAKQFPFALPSSILTVASLCLVSAAQAQKPVLQPATRFGATHAVPQTQHGPTALLQRIGQGSPTALSVTAADFYEDSTKNLVTGYALGNGGVLSIQDGLRVLPRVEEMATKAAFQPDANYIDLGIRPDFLKSADFNGDGHQDVIAATRGGSSIQVLLGDGHGNFTPQSPIAVDGQITALSPIRGATGQRLIAAAICGKSCSVNLFQFNGTLVASVPVDDKITILETARLNGTASEDIVAGGSSKLVVIDGQSALTSSPRVDRLPIGNAVSVTNGSFVYDARGYRQIAVLTNDGTLHTLARSGIISQPPVFQRNLTLPRAHRAVHAALASPSTLPWAEVETLNNIAQFNTEGTPTLLWSRVAGSGMDNVLILNVNGGAITTVLHQVVLYPSTETGVPATMKALPAKVEVESSSSGVVSGAIAMRTAQDSRLGLVMARKNARPEFNELPTHKTFTVNTTADGAVTTASLAKCTGGSSGCTLRSAIAAADADASTNEGNGDADTVNVPAGTYTLLDDGPEEANQATGGTDPEGNIQYHIEIYGPINLIGTAGAATTIITAANKDKVFSENSGNPSNDPNGFQPPIDAYFSGITLEDGTNQVTPTDQQNNGSIDNLAGLMDADTGISGNITVVNSIFQNGIVPFGNGGALFISDDIVAEGASGGGGNGNGTFTATGCTFSNNRTSSEGGAVSIGATSLDPSDVPATFSGDTFTSNSQALGSYGADDNNGIGQGGAIDFNQDDPGLGPPESTITTSTFTNNFTTSSAVSGYYADGGAVYTGTSMEITDSTFTGNTAGDEGGGIYMSSYNFTAQIAGNTITGNTAKYGGGIEIESFTSADISELDVTGVVTTVQDNLIHGNTASSRASTNGLGLGNFESGSTTSNKAVTATDNFWGCNGVPGSTGCDSAAVDTSQGSSALLTVSPYAVVTASLNASSISENGEITITGNLNSDSSGSSLSNLTAFAGLPTSINISVNSSTVATGSPDTNSSASASLNAFPSSPGSGVATFTIDNATATQDFTVVAPAPTANNQSVSVAYASSVGITLTASGSGTITYAIANSPSHGTISNFSSSAGTLTYQAAPGYVGADSFTFTASNGATSSPATVGITIEQIQPSISLSAPSTANRGTASALVATFTVPSGAPTPTASVNFYAGGTNFIGSAGLTQASSTTYTATLDAANLPAGQQTLTASYPGGGSYLTATSTGQSTFVTANYIWVGNLNGTSSAFDPIGTPYLSTAEPDGGFGIAIDNSGNIWSVNASSNSVAEFSETGSIVNAGYNGGGLSTPAAVAIDGSGRVWITNLNNSVSVFNSSGQPVSSSAYTGTTPGAATPPLSTPTSIAIDTSGNLWIANSGNGTVAEILGAASPTIAPIASGVTGNKPASKP